MTVQHDQHVRVAGRPGIFRFRGWDDKGNARLVDVWKGHLAAARASDVGLLCPKCQTRVDTYGIGAGERVARWVKNGCDGCAVLIGRVA